MTLLNGKATSASAVVNSFGVNTHIDAGANGYQNIAGVEAAINYLGIKNLRDAATNSADLGINGLFQKVADSTGAKFDDFIISGTPAFDMAQLAYVPQLASQGILTSVEGGNEADNPDVFFLGNSLAWTANFQQQIYAVAHASGIPVLNMSFGFGWTAANGYQGNYAAAGDLSAYTDFATAHTYPTGTQTPDQAIQIVNGLAHLAASSRPVATTEIGWDTSVIDPVLAAKYTLDAVFDGIRDGDAKIYFYALYNDGSAITPNGLGNWGLMNADGSAKPAGTALHNLTTILADPGAPRTDALSYGLSGMKAGDNVLIMEKSNGRFELALWNETDEAHNVTLTLGNVAQTLTLYDPLTGTSPIQTVSNSGSMTVTLPDHPIIVEIALGGTSAIIPNPVLTVQGAQTLRVGTAVNIGANVSDPWADVTTGTLALNVTTDLGQVWGSDASGNPLNGSGTSAIHVSGTLAQINTDLAGLAFSASQVGTASVVIDVYDQANVEVYKTVPIAVVAPNPVVTVPGALTMNVGTTLALSGLIVDDPWASINPGTAALNVTTTLGTVSGTDSSGNPLRGSGTGWVHVDGTLAEITADLGRLAVSSAQTGTTALIIDVWDQSGKEVQSSIPLTVVAPKPVVTVQGPATIKVGTTAIIAAGVSDPWAANVTGTLALNITTNLGTVSGLDEFGNLLSGSGSSAIHVAGTLAQINADLAHVSFISYKAGTAALVVDVYDQAGVEASKLIGIAVTS
jgi:hypothetical protein